MRLLPHLRALLSVFVVLVLAGPQAAQAMSKKPVATARVGLERTDAARWTLTFDLSQPVTELNLGPAYGDMRKTSWSPAEGFVLAGREEPGQEPQEVLRRADGAAFSRLTVDLRSWDAIVPKRYVPFNTFSDGGVSVFSGQFVPDGFETTFSFSPRPGEHVIVAGNPSTAPVTWAATSDAFVYFGAETPVMTKAALALVDPQTPRWLHDQLNEALPSLFAWYTEGFGQPLKERPLLLVAARFDEELNGYSIKGGVVPGQLQMRIRSQPIDNPNPAFHNMIVFFFAHEGAHLFQDIALTRNETAWIHEGGADALALEAVSELGYWDGDAIAKKRAEQQSICAAGLGEGPLDEAHLKGRFDLLYACGAIMTELTVRHLQKSNPDMSVLAFWKALRARADGTSPYTEALYRDVLEQQGGSWEAAEALSTFLHQPHEDGAAAIAELTARLS